MTPAEETQARRAAAIKRGHRIDALEPGQLANFIHRLAAIEPSVVDRVLAEFEANAAKPRTEKLLHPVTFYSSTDDVVSGLMAYCSMDPLWHEHIEDGQGLADLERVVRRHSGLGS